MSLAGASRVRAAPGWMVWVALWTVYIVWGSTYLAIRVMVETIPPFIAGGIRFVVAGGLMHAILLVLRGARGTRVTPRELGAAAVVAALLLLGGNGLVMVAEQEVPSGLTALIVASTPLWVVLLRAATRERVAAGTIAGVVVGFVGVGLLVLPGGSGPASAAGMATVLAASAFWAAGSFLSQRLPLPHDPFTSTAVQMILGGLMLTGMGIATGEGRAVVWTDVTSGSWFALGYLIVFGSLAAFTAYTWVLQHAPISRVATYAYVNPVVAVFLGWLLLDEVVTATIAAGAALIVASVAFIVRKETAPQAAQAPPEPAALREADGSR